MNVSHGHHEHDATLKDDGTLDTVVEIDGEEHRFSQDFAEDFREVDGTLTDEGFESLVREACDQGMLE